MLTDETHHMMTRSSCLRTYAMTRRCIDIVVDVALAGEIEAGVMTQ